MSVSAKPTIDLASLRSAAVGESLPVEVALKAADLPELSELQDFKLTATATKLEDRLLLAGATCATATLNCARCLRVFQRTISVDFSEEWTKQPTDEQFTYDGRHIDLRSLWQNVLFLQIPAQPLHDPDCQGLCPVCGKDLNRQPHQHRQTKAENPFSALKQLTKKPSSRPRTTAQGKRRQGSRSSGQAQG